MFGKVIKKDINKIGLPYAIIKGSNGVTFYCDDRGMEFGKVEDLIVGTIVEYMSYKDKKGKLIAMHLKCITDSEPKDIAIVEFTFEEKEKIKKMIIEYMKNAGSVWLTSLNNFLLGKKIDYHTYGYTKPKTFFKKNFSDILDFNDEKINGCPQTKIKLKEDVNNSSDLDSQTIQEQEADDLTNQITIASIYDEFDQLIENEDYDGALRSKLINSIAPDKLSMEYIEKALFAAHKILGMNGGLILSEFDKKIISTPKVSGLFIMKNDLSFMKEGREECIKDCNEKEFRQLFNALIATNKYNTTYLAVAIRFQTAYNKLYLPFYVLAAYTSRKIAVADEFLKFTQNNSIFESFVAVNKVIRETVFAGQEVSPNYITKVLSISLDSDRFDLFRNFILKYFKKRLRW